MQQDEPAWQRELQRDRDRDGDRGLPAGLALGRAFPRWRLDWLGALTRALPAPSAGAFRSAQAELELIQPGMQRTDA